MPDPPLRICYLIGNFFPRESGAERQALAQARELVRRGHSSLVLTQYIPGLPRDEELDGVKIHRWVRTTARGPLFGLSFIAGVIRALRRLRPEYDLIHTHQALWEAIATGLGRDFLRGAPVLVQPASSGYFGEAEEMARTKGFPILRRLALRNHRFAAISADIEDQWRALGVPSERIVRMASGVDATHFRPGPCAIDGAIPPRPRVVFTGRLHPQKNLSLLIDAWPEVALRTSANLVLVGDGPQREALTAIARDRGVADRVHFAGAVGDPAEYLRGADVFALPSVAEGMSNSLLEAMATGLCSLASDIGGNRDLITDGATGRLIPPGDLPGWTRALIEAVDDREASRQMGRRARSRVEQEFALPVVVDHYIALYRQMLARSARPTPA